MRQDRIVNQTAIRGSTTSDWEQPMLTDTDNFQLKVRDLWLQLQVCHGGKRVTDIVIFPLVHDFFGVCDSPYSSGCCFMDLDPAPIPTWARIRVAVLLQMVDAP